MYGSPAICHCEGRDNHGHDQRPAARAPGRPLKRCLADLGTLAGRYVRLKIRCEPSDATMRRWIARARERAAELGWPPLLGFAVPPSVGRVVHMNAGRCRPQRPAFVHSGVVVRRHRQA
jgi:hypothetical protein